MMLIFLSHQEFINTSAASAFCSVEVRGRKNIFDSKPHGRMSGLLLCTAGEGDLWRSSDFEMDKIFPPSPSTCFDL